MKLTANPILKLPGPLKYLLLIIWVLPNNIVKAQSIALTPKPQPWTIGVILVQESNPYYYYQFEPEYLKGFMAKRNYSQFSLRMALEYTFKTIPFDEPRCCDMQNKSGKFLEGLFRIGFEKAFVVKKYIKPYFALDFYGGAYKSDFEVTGGLFPVHQRVKTNIISFGGIPTLGLEFMISKNVSIAIESRTRFSYNILDKETNNVGSPNIAQFNDQFYNITGNRLGGLNLNVHF